MECLTFSRWKEDGGSWEVDASPWDTTALPHNHIPRQNSIEPTYLFSPTLSQRNQLTKGLFLCPQFSKGHQHSSRHTSQTDTHMSSLTVQSFANLYIGLLSISILLTHHQHYHQQPLNQIPPFAKITATASSLVSAHPLLSLQSIFHLVMSAPAANPAMASQSSRDNELSPSEGLRGPGRPGPPSSPGPQTTWPLPLPGMCSIPTCSPQYKCSLL